MIKKLLSSTLSVIIVMLLSCGNPTNSDDDPVLETGTVSDIEGNIYKTVKIGKQWWMAENLRVTKYNDGSAIPLVTGISEWEILSTPGYCYYNNATHADTIKKWGALYNWYVVSPTNPKQIAPAGWRVPDTTDWKILENYLIANGYNWDGTTTGNKIGKSIAAKTDWSSWDTAGSVGNDLPSNNRSGFSALPGGYRGSYDGNFRSQSSYGCWWSATEGTWSHAEGLNLYYRGVALSGGGDDKNCGFSVRLLRD